MGAWGASIMGFFGAAFAALTMYWQWRVSGMALAVPFLAFVLIGAAAVHVIRLPGLGITPSEKAQRAILWSSIGEGVALFLAANVVVNVHRPDLLLPAMASIVGLHFLPIGFAAAFRPFIVLGTTLILFAIVGFLLPSPAGGAIAGFMAAAALWIAAALALGRDRRVKRSSAAAG